MRKFLLAAAFLALTPAIAQAHAGPAAANARVHAIHRQVVQDRHAVREERRELHGARHKLRRDEHRLERARIARARARHHYRHG